MASVLQLITNKQFTVSACYKLPSTMFLNSVGLFFTGPFQDSSYFYEISIIFDLKLITYTLYSNIHWLKQIKFENKFKSPKSALYSYLVST
jgi:hypothetical protein